MEKERSYPSDMESQYEEGHPLTFIRVRFPGNAKSFPFLLGDHRFSYGQKVVAMSDRGMDIGYINSFPYTIPFTESMMPIHSISKKATEEDITRQKESIMKEKEYERTCLSLIEKHKLDMTLTHVELIQFGKKVVFYFNAPTRVDFRGLVRDLVSQLRMHIELRQITVRDRTAALGAIGVCGLQTCCSSFLKNYGSVNIKMPKNQNLTLIPDKLNGVCGQLKCCMKYEDQLYSHKRTYLPKEGNCIPVKNGDRGKVTRLHVLAEQFEMLTDQGQRRLYSISQYDETMKLPDNWSFPHQFDHIVNETSSVIGLGDPVPDYPHTPFPTLQKKTPTLPEKKQPLKEDNKSQQETSKTTPPPDISTITTDQSSSEKKDSKESSNEQDKKKKLSKYERRFRRQQNRTRSGKGKKPS